MGHLAIDIPLIRAKPFLDRLTVVEGRPQSLRLPGVGATRFGSVRGAGGKQVLVGGCGHRSWQLRCCLSLLFATVLAIAPVARPPLPNQPAAASTSADTISGDLQGERTAAGLRPAKPLASGIVVRLSLEAAPGLPPGKPALLRVVAEQPVPARRAVKAPGGEPRRVFERSSVGTARTPTGPPA